ncbi:MAG TPA: membrane dipeptidase [Solirubrobacteraceae bacterium]|nr:membrane dipeptidase [Solirubrobacteraceae bacterium]
MQPVFDGHNDALTVDDHEWLVSGRAGGHLDLPRMRAGGVRGAIFAVFTEGPKEREALIPREDGVREFEYASPVDHVIAAADAAAVAGRLLRLEREGAIQVARRIGDVDRARSEDGPPVAVLHLEGAEAISPDLESLDLWYQAGLRSLGPVWSRANAFGWGVPFISPASPDIGPGLTRAGRALVERCAELGILVDVSHLNEAGFWDVARLEPGPIVASHAGVHAVAAASRNLTDAELDEIGTSGGLVGIVFAAPFLRDDFADDPETPLELIARHARYAADRIGVEHVALGSDFDGATIPRAIGGADGMPRVLEALRDEGFTEAEVDAIAWANWRRVLAAWWRD